MIGKKRGMLISGGEVDIERASVMLLDEYREGRLGSITLEMPEVSLFKKAELRICFSFYYLSKASRWGG